VEVADDPHMDSELSPEFAKEFLANQNIYQNLDKCKFPDYIISGSIHANVNTQSTLAQQPLVKTKHIFDNLMVDIEPPKDHMKRTRLPQC
jgi:hypothetical protein